MPSAAPPRLARPAMDPRVRQRRVEVMRQLGRKRLRAVVAAAGLCAAAALFLLVIHSGLFSAQHVAVRGSLHTPDSTVIEVAGLSQHPPLVDLDAGLISRRLERLPWVRTARMDLRWPDSVVVLIEERVPVATIGTGTRLDLVDGSGRVLAYVSQAPPTTVALEVPGASSSARPPGSVLPAIDGPALVVARAVPPILEGRVHAVMMGAHGSVTLDLGGGITAALGTVSQLPEKFEALASVLAGAHVRAPALIDLTVPDEPAVTPG